MNNYYSINRQKQRKEPTNGFLENISEQKKHKKSHPEEKKQKKGIAICINKFSCRLESNNSLLLSNEGVMMQPTVVAK